MTVSATTGHGFALVCVSGPNFPVIVIFSSKNKPIRCNHGAFTLNALRGCWNGLILSLASVKMVAGSSRLWIFRKALSRCRKKNAPYKNYKWKEEVLSDNPEPKQCNLKSNLQSNLVTWKAGFPWNVWVFLGNHGNENYIFSCGFVQIFFIFFFHFTDSSNTPKLSYRLPNSGQKLPQRNESQIILNPLRSPKRKNRGLNKFFFK